MKKPFHVIYEDNHLIIVNKAAGVIVHADKTGDKTLEDYVKEYIKEKYNKPGDVFLGTIHRLDRPVSGLIIFARTSKGLERMNALFKKRDIQKTYWAVTQRKPPKKKDKLTNYLVKDHEKNVVTAHDYPVENAKKAELHYRYLGTINKFHLLEIEPITGRPHQIRVQLAAMGCPIKGDLKYGYPKPNRDASINLHSRRVYFIHPVKKEPVLCRAALPEDPFWEEFLALDNEDIKDDTMKFLH
ncbi:RluA family pseudouridine synthase [Jiulongibacter sp. NS-SX5]|uniref:RluA family pseudouridine synthase n=1 Tax=Jiulongibacter sp. NS-SX5 TaxID=3463854 RepID=UPI0040595DBE